MMRLSLCHLPFDAIVGMLLVGCGAASGQSVPSGSPSLHARIEAVARALQDAPRLKNLSEQERIDRVEFVIGNTLFILLHELGHLHLSDMHLAGIGREEDEADTFAAVTLLKVGTSFSQRVLADASQGWFLRQRRNQQKGAKPPYYDQHDISEQRAYQIVCLMVGSDPVKFESVADEAKMPKWRQQSCKYDYAKESRSWDMVLAPYLRSPEQPETKINIIYGDAQGIFEGFPRTFRALQILETVAERSASIRVVCPLHYGNAELRSRSQRQLE